MSTEADWKYFLEQSVIVDRRDFIVPMITRIWTLEASTQMSVLILFQLLLKSLVAVEEVDDSSHPAGVENLLTALTLSKEESIAVDKKRVLIALACALKTKDLDATVSVMEKVLSLENMEITTAAIESVLTSDHVPCINLGNVENCVSEANACIGSALEDARLSPEHGHVLRQCLSVI